MTLTEKAIRDFCGHHADWWPSITQVQEILALAQPCSTCEALARTVMMDQTAHDTTPPAQPAPVQPVADLHFFKQVLSVAIAGLYEHYEEDVMKTFSVEELSEVVDLSESLRPRQVEDIYKQMWAMLATPPAQAQQKPVASLFSAIQAEPVTLIHKWRVLKLAKEHAAQPPQRKPLTDVMIKKWAERHDIKGVMTALRCMAEDAETLYLLAEEENT